MKLHSLRIKDELQGQLRKVPQYLACSVLKKDNLSSQGTGDPHEKEVSVILLEDEDTFTDALPEFLSLRDLGLHSQDMDVAQCGIMGYIDNRGGSELAGVLIHEKDSIQETFSDEIFYEAQGGDDSDFVSVTFLARSSGSHDYDGIDTQVKNQESWPHIEVHSIYLP